MASGSAHTTTTKRSKPSISKSRSNSTSTHRHHHVPRISVHGHHGRHSHSHTSSADVHGAHPSITGRQSSHSRSRSIHASRSPVVGGLRDQAGEGLGLGLRGRAGEIQMEERPRREEPNRTLTVSLILLFLCLIVGAIIASVILTKGAASGNTTTTTAIPGSTPLPFCPNQVLPKDLNDSLAVGDFCYKCVRSNPNVTSALPSKECRVECCDVFYPNDIGKFTDCYFRCTQ